MKAKEVSLEAQSKPSVQSLLFDNLLSADELARDMKRSKLTVYKWVRRGCPRRRIGGRIYFDAAEVAQWIKRTSE